MHPVHALEKAGIHGQPGNGNLTNIVLIVGDGLRILEYSDVG